MLTDLGDTEDGIGSLAATMSVNSYMIGYQLRKILVWGNDNDALETAQLGSMGNGADDVVGLEPLGGELRYAECVDDAANPGEVREDLLGHRVAVGLVLGVNLVAESRRRQVESNGHMGWLLRTYEVE